MVVVFALVALLVLGLLAGVHRYLWQRLVRDVSRPGGPWRRVGTVLVWVLPLITVATFVSSRGGAPFTLQRVLAWPGYLWLALVLYVTLALLVGEAVRPLLRRWLARRDAAGAGRNPTTASAGRKAPSDSGPEGEADADGHGRTGGPRSPAGGAESAPAPGGADGTPEPAAASRETAAPVAVTTAERPAGMVEPDGEPASGGPEGEPASGSRDGAASASAETPGAGASGEAPGRDAERSGTPRPEPESGPEPDAREVSRRLFVSRVVGTGAALVGTATVGAGAYSVLNGPTLKRITVPLAKLPRRAHGYRIAVVSDVHIGPVLGRAHTRRVVETINRAQPDLVAIVGDLVDGTVDDLGPAAAPLRELRSRDGNFFVTGNHEYFGDADSWVDHLRELNIHTLANTRREMPWFDLAGVNDVQGEEEGEGPDFQKALGDRDTARASVLLAHQPVQIHDAVDHGVDLQLSGHTHGGQLWPGEYLAGLANPTVAGLERYGDTQLYVSRGAGAWGPPVRVGAESDVTVVELASRRT
ncbi:metallophosphoesterase [Streptomyces sp. AJS327]|uniref:metallophosphoesterase n=1 Tax=Streptomyces sp. AJS327 TaxID=2545265 RepID=UPI0015DE028A|nr:metallophosphoesterase [Streptomyces sp. AJS327]MBA0054165.1 metallophosphoesterase [Streptomyces sp. AJS327]